MAMENQENVAPVEEGPWWTDLATEASGGTVKVEGGRVETFSRVCYRQFFQQKMKKETYFQCCCVAWMIQCLDRDGLTAGQLWDAALSALAVAGDESCMAGWILPSLAMDDLKALAKAPSEDPEEHKIYLLIQLWKRFYKACETAAAEQATAARPTKRQRTTYQYFSSSSSSLENSFDGLLKGAYKIPTAILLSSILLHCTSTNEECPSSCPSWQYLHDQVYRLPNIFKTMTAEDIQSALAVLGMQCLMQGHRIAGLTPCFLLDHYVTRTGESTLSVLKEVLCLDYYPLRAAICEHLLEPVYSPDEALTEAEIQATIRACCDFLNREQPSVYIQKIKEPTGGGDEQQQRKEVPSANNGLVPERCLTPRYPLLTHLGAWLLQDDILRAIDLVRTMEHHPHLDGFWKDEAYLHIWQHLLRQGKIFLDGNHSTPDYIPKRELLYNGVVSGMGAYGRGSMMDFYQTLSQTVWDHPLATLEEKHYVLVACQQTLLRLLFKCRGLGTMTVLQFLQDTTWPIPLQENNHKKINGVSLLSASTTSDLDVWAAEFLSHSNPIPESLLAKDEKGNSSQVLDLTRLVEAEPVVVEETKVAAITAPIVEAELPEPEPVPTVAALTAPPQDEPMAPEEEEEPDALDVDGDVAVDQQEEEEEEEEEEDYKSEDYESEEQESEEQDEEAFDVDDEQASEEDEALDPKARQHLEQEYAAPPNRVEPVDVDDDDDDVVEIVEDSKPAAVRRDPSTHHESLGGMDDNDEEEFYEYEEEDRSTEMQRGKPKQHEDERGMYSSSSEEEDHQDEKPRHHDRASGLNYSDEDEQDSEEEDPDAKAHVQQRGIGHMYSDEEEQDSADEHDRSSSEEEEEEEEADDDSSSDGGGAGGGENEAVVIRDSEDDEPVVPPGHMGDHARHDLDNDSDERYSDSDQFQNADNARDIQDEYDDSLHGGPHRIARAQGEALRADSSDDDEHSGEEEIQVLAPQNAVEPGRYGLIIQQPSGDDNDAQQDSEEEEEEEEEIHQDQGDVVEIIDDSEEEEGRSEVEEAAPVPSESKSPFAQSMNPEEADNSGEKDNDAANTIASIFENAAMPSIPEGVPLENSQIETKLPTPPQVEETKLPEEESKADHHESEPEDTKMPAFESSVNEERDNAESDATDDEEERAIEVEKAETEDAAVGGEFGGDTTEEETEQATSSRANMLADADRRADVLRARTGYASQLEDGYEPEDTHGYTEEEVSEAIHTEDEEEERRAAQEAQKFEVSVAPRKEIEPVRHSGPHSSDDMDAADEHEEDLGAESSELEETAEARDYSYSPTSEHEKDPTSLLDFAKSAQRLHLKGRRSSAAKAAEAAAQPTGGKDEDKPAEHSPIDVDDENKVAEQDEEGHNDSDNFASVEDDKEADSTMATESLEMTEDTADHGDSEAEGPMIHGDNSVEHEETMEKTVTEMAVEPTSESLNAYASPVANQDNFMETESPGQGLGMDVDDNMERIEDIPMIEGEVATNDAVMEPADPPESEHMEFAPVENNDSVEMAEVTGDPTKDDILVGEDLLEEGASDAEMDTKPASTVESTGMLVEVNNEAQDEQEVAAMAQESQSKDIPQEEGVPKAEGSEVAEEASVEEQEGSGDDSVQEIPKTEGVSKTGEPQVEDSHQEKDEQAPVQPTDEASGANDDSVPISAMVPSRRGIEDKPEEITLQENEDGHESKDDDESKDSRAESAPVRRSKRQRTPADDSPAVSEDDEKPASSKTKRSTRNTRSKALEVEDDESAASSRPASRRSNRSKPQNADESATSATRTSTRIRGKKAENDDGEDQSVASTASRTARGRGKKAEDDDGEDQSVASTASRTGRGRAPKQPAADDASVVGTASTKRSTRSRKDKDNDDEDEKPKTAKRITRAAASKKGKDDSDGDDKEDEESATSSRPSIRRTTRSKPQQKSDDTAETSTSAKRTTRARGKKTVNDDEDDDKDDQSVTSAASRTRSTRGRAAKKAKKEDDTDADDNQSVTSTASRGGSRSTAAGAGAAASTVAAADDDDSVASASSTAKRSLRSTRSKAKDEAPAKPATRAKKEGLPPRPPTRASTRKRK